MELMITSRTVADEEGRPRRYHYSLLVDQIDAGNFAWEHYGVRVAEEGGPCAAVPGITTSAMRIDELMTLLVEHRVGPATLKDVVVDWL